LPGDGEGGGASVGADDGLDAGGVDEKEDALDGHVGVAGGIDGEAFDGLAQDAPSFVQLLDGEVEGLLSGLGGLGGVGEVQDEADFQVILGRVRV